MALRNLIWTHPEGPYFRPPPLHICIVKLIDQPRVVTWDFSSTNAKPALIKMNKTAIISDGKSLAKITLFEEFGRKVTEGNSYIMKGHTVKGQELPLYICVSKNTLFFRSADIMISDTLHTEAVALVNPRSPETHLRDACEVQGMMTLKGKITEASLCSRVRSGKEFVPVKKVVLTQTEKKESHSVTIIGVMEKTHNVGDLDVLLDNGEVYGVDKEVWAPFDTKLKVKKIQAMIVTSTGKILETNEVEPKEE